MNAAVKAILSPAKNVDDYIDEQSAATLLKISIRTIHNYVSNGSIPSSYYTVGIKGKRFYNKAMLMGVKVPPMSLRSKSK